MNTSVARTEAGVTLLLALLAMTIVGGVAYRVLLYAEAYREIARTFANSLITQQQLRARIDTSSTSQRSCVAQAISHPGGTLQEWQVCSRGTQPFLTNHPISLPPGRIDYNLLFGTPSRCPGQTTATPDLPTRSPTSGNTCELPSHHTHNLFLLDNIRCHNLVLDTQEANQSLTIATVGSLLCDEVLTLSSSTLIVAGGDIKIPTIMSASSKPIAITIISAHGDVVVGNTSGLMSLLALGRHTLAVPMTQAPETYLLPPFTPLMISGVKSS
jgi:hypothetical protein